jgi:hypothetical protein
LVDHYSYFVYVTFHTSKDVNELIRSKEEFELWAKSYNITIKDIQVDNGIYAAKAFQTHCLQHQQHPTFCAVGAHWQNGITEHFVSSITERARTIVLHAMAKWPSIVLEKLWPFAIRHSMNFHNAMIHQGQTPCLHKLFTSKELK